MRTVPKTALTCYNRRLAKPNGAGPSSDAAAIHHQTHPWDHPRPYPTTATGVITVTSDDRTCASGPTCKAHNGRTAYPTPDPLCPACLTAAERDIRPLVYDYLDLAQLHETSLSQALNDKTSGSADPPMLLAGHVDELQTEIVHALSVWEYEIRVTCRLHDPNTFAPLWRTTVYDHLNLIQRGTALHRARSGMIVQRAVDVILPRLPRLAALPATIVCPAGVEDEPVTMYGWEAVHQLQSLHHWARALLGRTTRRFWIPGACWTCQAYPTPGTDGPLYRSEPRRFEDPMEVHCATCAASRPYSDYEQYMGTLLWPEVPAPPVAA